MTTPRHRFRMVQGARQERARSGPVYWVWCSQHFIAGDEIEVRQPGLPFRAYRIDDSRHARRRSSHRAGSGTYMNLLPLTNVTVGRVRATYLRPRRCHLLQSKRTRGAYHRALRRGRILFARREMVLRAHRLHPPSWSEWRPKHHRGWRAISALTHSAEGFPGWQPLSPPTVHSAGPDALRFPRPRRGRRST